jgi:hypothetical protein
LSDPEEAVTVRLTLAAAAVLAALMVTVCWPPEASVNCAGEAVTPAGIPVTVMLACELNPFKPVMPTVTEAEDPGATVTFAGSTVSVKSGGGGGAEPPPPPPDPPQLESISAARIRVAVAGSRSAKPMWGRLFMFVFSEYF